MRPAASIAAQEPNLKLNRVRYSIAFGGSSRTRRSESDDMQTFLIDLFVFQLLMDDMCVLIIK